MSARADDDEHDPTKKESRYHTTANGEPGGDRTHHGHETTYRSGSVNGSLPGVGVGRIPAATYAMHVLVREGR